MNNEDYFFLSFFTVLASFAILSPPQSAVAATANILIIMGVYIFDYIKVWIMKYSHCFFLIYID